MGYGDSLQGALVELGAGECGWSKETAARRSWSEETAARRKWVELPLMQLQYSSPVAQLETMTVTF